MQTTGSPAGTMIGRADRQNAADEMTEESEPQHPLHPERVANRGADQHRDGHSQKGHAGNCSPSFPGSSRTIDPRRQDVAARHERKGRGNQGDAARHEQSTRIRCAGISGANTFATARGGKLLQKAGMIVNNRAEATMPGGSRSKFRQRLKIKEHERPSPASSRLTLSAPSHTGILAAGRVR